MRRSLALILITPLIAAACGSPPDGETNGSARTMQSLADETQSTYVLALPPGAQYPVGVNRIVFALLDQENAFLPNKALQIYYGEGPNATARGPVDVTFEDDGLGDRAFYRAAIEFPEPGNWVLLVMEKGATPAKGGGSTVQVVAETSNPKVGDQAVSVKTATFDDHLGIPDICTRDPEDPMHDISLDVALQNGKPTVLIFAVPAFCRSRTCGPVLEQVLRVREEFKDQANFIHVEPYVDPQTQQELVDAFAAWKLETEPYVFVIDNKGIIQGAFEGPVTTGEIKAVLGQIL